MLLFSGHAYLFFEGDQQLDVHAVDGIDVTEDSLRDQDMWWRCDLREKLALTNGNAFSLL